MPEYTGLLLATIGLLGIAAQWLGWWLKLPSILFLLLVGVIAGPVTGLVRPDQLMGDLLFPFVSLGVAVILFEGGLTLRLHEIRGLENVVRNLVTIGALTTWLITALATRYLLGLSWELSLLFGAVVTVTGPTVIIPMLRTVRPTANIANILRWEGIIIDPLGALLAVLVFEFIVSGREGYTALVFGQTVLIGTLAGVVGGYILATILRRHLMPEYLHDVASLVLVLGVFTVANALLHESGLLAVTVMGIMLANMKDVPIEDILDFKESLSVLLISVLFIILAARIDFAAFDELGINAWWVLATVMLIARPATVLISSLRSKLNWREKALLAWIGPRGIVAAAVSAVFAIKLEILGYEQAHLLVPLTFMVIVGTVVLQSATAGPLASWLGVAEPEPRGVLIVGAHEVARAIGRALSELGYRTLIADTNWQNLRAARMEGVRTYYGEAVSAHADRHLDLVGIGRLFAMSRRPTSNALACIRYRSEFSADSVFALQVLEEQETAEQRKVPSQYGCPLLFGKDVTYSKLARLLSNGAIIRATQLTENFDFKAYRDRYGAGAILLFAMDKKQHLYVFSTAREIHPEVGWTVVSLLPPEAAKDARKSPQESGRKAAREDARTEIAKKAS